MGQSNSGGFGQIMYSPSDEVKRASALGDAGSILAKLNFAATVRLRRFFFSRQERDLCCIAGFSTTWQR